MASIFPVKMDDALAHGIKTFVAALKVSDSMKEVLFLSL